MLKCLRNAGPWRRSYSVSLHPVPLLRREAEKAASEGGESFNSSSPEDEELLREAAGYAGMDPSEIRIVRPLKLVYTHTDEVPVLYNAGPKDTFGRVWCESFGDILKALGTERKSVAWQICGVSMLTALEVIGSISHIEPGTRVVSNSERTRKFVIVDLKQKQEMCDKLKLLPTDRLATGLGLCTVPMSAVESGAFKPVETPEGYVELKIDESKYIIYNVDRHLRREQLGMEDWLRIKTRASALVVRHCAVVDISRIGGTSNLAIFWPKRDRKFLSLVQKLLRDIGIRTRGCVAEWGPFQTSHIREIRMVPRQDITELERERIEEPRWLCNKEIVPLRSSLPPAVVLRTLRIRQPIIGPGCRRRPRYWFRLLQKKGPDMKDSDGGFHGFRHVPLLMANRRKLNRAQRLKYGFKK